MDKELIERFRTLFCGFDGAHGRFEIQYENDTGKQQGKAQTFRNAPKEEDWDMHLSGGKAGLGVIPLRRDNSVFFAALDIDDKQIDLLKLEKACEKLPVVICRSKSGGAHVYLFLKEPVSARRIVPILNRWSSMLGYGGCEIFPKQISRASEKDVGNWINLPYFNANNTVRYAIKEGKKLSLAEFLDYAESRRVDMQDKQQPIPGQLDNSVESMFYEAPPCMQHLFQAGGFPDGTRNDGLYNVGVYLKKRYPDDYETRLQEYNLKMCKPPLSISEIAEIAKSIKKKNYAYKCQQSPIKPHCDRRCCLGRRFGIGESGDSTVVEITSITKYEGDPVYWVIELGGQRVEMSTDDLYVQANFAKQCMNTLNRCPPAMPTARWHAYLDAMLKGAPAIPAPEDASRIGQIWIIIDSYCFGRLQAKHPDELLQGKPWQSEGRVYFRSASLFEYFRIKKLMVDSEHWVWNRLREGGGKSQQMRVRGKNINVWSLPIPDAPELLSLNKGAPDDGEGTETHPTSDPAQSYPNEPAQGDDEFDFSENADDQEGEPEF